MQLEEEKETNEAPVGEVAGWGGDKKRRRRETKEGEDAAADWECQGKGQTLLWLLPPDKRRETAAWINPAPVLFTEMSSVSSPVYKWAPAGGKQTAEREREKERKKVKEGAGRWCSCLSSQTLIYDWFSIGGVVRIDPLVVAIKSIIFIHLLSLFVCCKAGNTPLTHIYGQFRVSS